MSAEDAEQQRALQAAVKIVKENAFFMKRAMDSDNINQAIDCAVAMLKELKNNFLHPKQYYDLYMKVLDELREFEEYLSNLQKSGRNIVSIYEQVQSCNQALPRLYLMCCVGGVYISSLEAPAKDILKDMVEMTKGVQHPMRGLFLRNYLTQVSKNRLPDVGTVFEGAGGSVQDAFTFVLQNFSEANRLWVRLQQGASKDKKKREKERLDLRILVGANLVRLSQLDGLDLNEYKTTVLPKILEEVIGCKDTIAQGYLMDCIIQIFPDEFHLAALEAFLNACTQLKEKVSVKTILESMIERLTNYVDASNGSVLPDTSSFKLFNDCVTTIIDGRSNLSLTETLRLQTVLANFALKCFPTRIDFVTHCLAACSLIIEKTDFAARCAAETSSGFSEDSKNSVADTISQIEALLYSPLKVLALKVLEIPAYIKLMSLLPWDSWKGVSSALLRAVISSNTSLPDIASVERLFGAVAPLLCDNDGGNTSAGVPLDEDADSSRDSQVSQGFKEEQQLVARVVHLLRNDDTDEVLRMLVAVRAKFVSGGPQRMQFTLMPSVFSALSLARRVVARERLVTEQAAQQEKDEDGEAAVAPPPQFSSRKVFQYIMEAIVALAPTQPEQALKLFLHAAQAADECNFSAISYEFIKEALLLYEGEISDSKLQVRTLTSVIGALLNCRNFPSEDYEALITKVAQYANKLLKKPDQCRMVTLCSHLFYRKNYDGSAAAAVGAGVTIEAPGGTTGAAHYSDPDRSLECMQRALKIASVSNPNLFVEILDRYIYYFEIENPSIKVSYLSGLIALINEQLGAGAEGQSNPAVEAHYKNTLDYITTKQRAPETSEKFLQIQAQ